MEARDLYNLVLKDIQELAAMALKEVESFCQRISSRMEGEQEENQKQLKELTLSLRRFNEQESDVRTFIREIRQYATIQELDEGILNRLISRILVGGEKD